MMRIDLRNRQNKKVLRGHRSGWLEGLGVAAAVFVIAVVTDLHEATVYHHEKWRFDEIVIAVLAGALVVAVRDPAEDVPGA